MQSRGYPDWVIGQAVWGRGALCPPPWCCLSRTCLGVRTQGVALGHSQQVTGGGGGFGQRKQALARRKRGRFSCLLRHPPPNGMDWQLPQTGTRLGSCPSLGARLQPEITAGWVEVGSKNKFQIGRNFV